MHISKVTPTVTLGIERGKPRRRGDASAAMDKAQALAAQYRESRTLASLQVEHVLTGKRPVVGLW
ncbi:hypothetical protein EYF80_021415 [Liparis tanakae]|uniref:Uncharacterized protein n=1 Tax=Liparis tanakae TaxID=230148 RepID=A0A4Z2HU04_9TELE|nr:hypothetical protein EYF80_021415 [Liparis tanakae]